MELTQINAIIRYESTMQWRRRSWFVATVGIIVFMLLLRILVATVTSGSSIFTESNLVDQVTYKGGYTDPNTGQWIGKDPEWLYVTDHLDPTTVTSVQLAQVNNLVLSLYSLWIGALVLILMPAIMMSEIVPLDQQFKVRSVLNSTPLRYSVYLGAKILSVWANLFKVAAVSALIGGAGIWLLFGPFDLGIYLLMWLLVILPPALFTGSIGVLLGSLAPNRRRATYLSVLALPLYLAAYGVAIINLINIVVVFSPIYRFTNMVYKRTESNIEIISDVLQAYGVGVLVLGGLFIGIILVRHHLLHLD